MAQVMCSEEMREYFDSLQSEADRCYKVARSARSKGFDPELDVEIPQTEDLASRVESLLENYGVAGVARRIRELSRNHDREMVSILVAKEMASRPSKSKEEAVERAVRVGLAILTEGILVAPLEGLADLKIKRNNDGSTYVDLHYAGPIRSAGGTGQALSVLIADIVRRDLGVGQYRPQREEIERFKEEIPLYKQAQHLQYTPSNEEIELIVSNCPVCINGEGTEDLEISGYRDLPRIETNRVRGGACLVLADGLCLKAPKIQKHVRKLGIDGWEYIDRFLSGKEKEIESPTIEPSEKFIQNLVAGRPVLCHPSRPGGLRLRYGRTRATGLAALGLHPATMVVMGEYIAVGTQIKIERPGKAAAVTPCESVEGPLVLLDNGDFVSVDSEEDARKLAPKIRKIIDLGEILVPFGEFLENNHVLMPGAYSLDVHRLEVEKAGGLNERWVDPTPEDAIEFSRKKGVPLHPKYNLFWHDLSVSELRELRGLIQRLGTWSQGKIMLKWDERLHDLFLRLGVTFRRSGEYVIPDRHSLILLNCLGMRTSDTAIEPMTDCDADDPMEYVAKLGGIVVRARGPTRIGARMARPEKAAPRKMQPAPHALFPLGRAGGNQRLLREALAKDTISAEVGLRICEKCGKRWFLPKCTCGGHTRSRQMATLQKIPLRNVVDIAMKNVNMSKAVDVKAVQGMISRSKTPESLEKGLLRAKHDVYVFKDGTCRFDMTNLPLTHFKPSEVGLTVDMVRRLGYERDMDGKPVESADQILELKPQDLIIAEDCCEYLMRVAAFVDDLLEHLYGLPRFYRVSTREDLIGHLAVGLAPHTSGGVLCRLIGYTPAQACFAHPYFHAAKRRNADGDEDSVILLLDSLLNFSRLFLPEKRGGLMDAPLVLTTRIDPNEIDKEAHSIDVARQYPHALYEAADRFAHPREVEKYIDMVGKRVGSLLQYEGLGYTVETGNICAGPLVSTYVKGDMEEKIDKELELTLKIRAVDASDMVSRLIVHHFLPDLIGNLKAFSSQQVRCTKCNSKFRRIPLRGRCTDCGGNLTLTVHENSVKKYLEISKSISQEYGLSNYLRQRLGLLEEAINSLFTNDKAKTLKLDDFL